MQPLRTQSRRTLLDHGKYLRVDEHVVEFPDGRTIEHWPWLILPDFVNVIVVTRDGRFPCFRQTKYAIEGTSIAPVGGYVEPGEDPLACARRELLEEAGYEAAQWTLLGTYPVDANRGAGNAWFYLAEEARFAGRGESDDLEEQQPLLLTRAELDAVLDNAEVKALPWVACFLAALRVLDSRG